MKSEIHETMPPTELPAPETKAPVVPELGTDQSNATELAGAKSSELPQTMSPSPLSPQLNPVAPVASVPPKTGDDFTTMPTGTTPGIADDNDLIEKEWVQKAKAIVAKTQHDPYEQNKEMSIYKSDYVKKRFNKDIKVNDT